MRWTLLGLAGALSFSEAFASGDSPQNAKLSRNPSVDFSLRDANLQIAESRNATTPNLFSRFLHHFDTRQEVGRCGASGGGSSCTGNQCCSSFDYCGNDNEYVWSYYFDF